ncbi:MAG: hypothetical protein EOS85_35115 [Mesorhizobium sp.]|nr:MAG: hypothetical protein EOS85_35115 [Mesorhizobium sp.]
MIQLLLVTDTSPPSPAVPPGRDRATPIETVVSPLSPAPPPTSSSEAEAAPDAPPPPPTAIAMIPDEPKPCVVMRPELMTVTFLASLAPPPCPAKPIFTLTLVWLLPPIL